MCGLAGWFSPAPSPPDAGDRLASMLDAIAHRGPDGRGAIVGPHFGLGHVRLAIIDLATGAQPMHAVDGSAVIVFNGEIYNFAALAAQLRAAGHAFATRSDTEVILNLYRAEGVAGFARLRGMFALAIWDYRTGGGCLARDRYGMKPLFYAAGSDGALAFASEAKAIGAASSKARGLDENALHLALNFRYLPGTRTLFRGIRQLAPGTVLEWHAGGSRVHAIGPWPQGRALSDLAALEDSVHAHLVADVEVATYLSGGIDSAAVTALARRHSIGRLRSFTVAVGDDPAEADHAARTAALLDVDNVRVEPDDARVDLARLVWHLEVPKVNAWQSAEVARATARHVKVALSGLGGDEWYYGYNLHRWLDQGMRAARWAPRWLRALADVAAGAVPVLGAAPWSEPERALRAFGALNDWPRVYGLLRNLWDAPRLRSAIYGPRLLDRPLDDAYEELRAHWPADPDPVQAAARFERRHKMVNDLLWQEDRMSMAAGLEVRVPFVDPQVEAAATAVPRAELMPGGRLKAHLRSILGPLLPAEILARPKSGFQVDAVAFFGDELAPFARAFLNEPAIRRYGLFNPRFVGAILARPRHRWLRWHYFLLYLMLGAHVWLELFELRRTPADIALAT
jgi:asparagine synthase (glutamine-hydrolysing)